MMNRRKDSENFPTLDHKATQKDVIDPTKEIEFKEKPAKKKESKPLVPEKPKEPIVLENYKQVIKGFEDMMKDIKPGKNLEKVKDLPILDLNMVPTVEELHPTKPREVFRGSRKKRRKIASRKQQQGEQISLTKGRYAK